ncbi:MAG: hypothetical protein AB7O67_12075 [Vicinamibacterales bacterium]
MTTNPLLAPLPDSERREFGGMTMDIVRTGAARVKRMIYPAGFQWSKAIKPLVGGDVCEHAHVGFLAHGAISVHFPDGCSRHYTAPAVVVIEPGHDASVGDDGAVLVEFDFERETIEKLGVPPEHRHG